MGKSSKVDFPLDQERLTITSLKGLHTPVLLKEVLELLKPKPWGRYLDSTIGLGGHAEAILERSAPSGFVYGIDRDAEALELARARLHPFSGRVMLLHGNFRDLSEIAKGWGPFDGILFDLGVSFFQLADPERGFSFLKNGPLDMRMDRSGGRTAAELLKELSEGELTRILREYGEERWAPRIAKTIIKVRKEEPLVSTRQLRELVEWSIPRRAWPKRIHPATRTFQAIRIATNDELRGLGLALEKAAGLLSPGERIVVIAFHSLEDRIVKETFKALSLKEPRAFRTLTKKPLVPSEEELERNPRSRSAKLRALEREA